MGELSDGKRHKNEATGDLVGLDGDQLATNPIENRGEIGDDGTWSSSDTRGSDSRQSRDEKNLREDFSNLRKEFSSFGQQLSTILSLFSKIPNASLPADFPPRANTTSILARTRVKQHTPKPMTEEQLELVPESSTRGAIANPYYTPMLRLDIPVFEGDKPRWWIRRCERFFYHYRVTEG